MSKQGRLLRYAGYKAKGNTTAMEWLETCYPEEFGKKEEPLPEPTPEPVESVEPVKEKVKKSKD